MNEIPDNIEEVQVEHADEVMIIQPAPGFYQRPFAYLLLWVLVLLSLLMNVVLLRQAIRWRQTANLIIDEAVAVLDGLERQSFTHTIIIDDNIAVQTDLPVNQTIPVEIDEMLPIQADVTVPVDTRLFGTINLNVPIDTTVPVQFTEEIVINQTFSVDTTVPIHLEVPIDIAVANTPFADTLNDLQARLELVSEELNQPLIPLPFDQ